MRNVQERKTLTAAALSDMRLIVPPRSWQPSSSDVVATHNNEPGLTNRRLAECHRAQPWDSDTEDRGAGSLRREGVGAPGAVSWKIPRKSDRGKARAVLEAMSVCSCLHQKSGR